jgi:perosamine synthetase
MIPIYKPYLPAKSLAYAHDALDSTWISSQGKYLQEVREKLQELLGVRYVLPVNNGTSACHLVAKALINNREFKYTHRRQIIVPDSVYVAAWNAFLFDDKYDLIVIGTDLDTWNFDEIQLEAAIALYPEAAVLVVHNIGNIINVPKLQAKYPNTWFVEDNCEGFMGQYNGLSTGTAAFASAISFFGNKNITSGEGGAVVLPDEDTFNYIKNIHSQGQSTTRFVHNNLGYNYRMTNIQAAILMGQLELLPEIMEMKEEVFDRYRTALKDQEKILMQTSDPTTKHANWMFGIRVPGKSNYQQAELYFKGHGIDIRPMFYPIRSHDHLRYNSRVNWRYCPNADLLNQECFILPSYPELTKKEQEHILTTLQNFVEDK